MLGMDRMLLDLNFPPPPHWSPQAVPVLSPSPAPQSSAPEGPVPKDTTAPILVEPNSEAGCSLSPSPASNLAENKGPELELESLVTNDALLIWKSPTAVMQDMDVAAPSNSNLGNSSPSQRKHMERSAENIEDDRLQAQVLEVGTDTALAPSTVDAIDDDVEVQPEKPRSVTVDSDDMNPTEEAPGDRGGAVKVHKRLRTLGQLRGRKEEKDAKAAIPGEALNAECLEDDIIETVSESEGRNGVISKDDDLASARFSRVSTTQLRSRRGDKIASSSNGDVRNDDQSRLQNGDASSKAQMGELFLPGRSAKIPSQPRSRKPDKRAKVIAPPVHAKGTPEGQVAKTEAFEEKPAGGVGSCKSSRVDNPMLEGCDAGIAEIKAEEQKEQSQVSSDAAQPAGVKRPSVGLKDAMPGKRRRQTVLLEVDESLKHARPLRPASTEGPSGRISRFRRDVARPVLLTQLSEKQETENDETVAASSVEMQASTSYRPEEPSEGPLKSERYLTMQSSESTGQFRRPVLKRQPSAAFARDDSSVTGSSSFNRAEVAKLLISTEMRGFGGSSEGLESQKPRRIPRKADGKKQALVVQDASIERLHREATCSKLWQTSGTLDLQKVPGRFESVEDYVRVLEPLLFEECRAQLYSSWEELLEGSIKDAHTPVSIKGVVGRERGWFDVIVLPENPNVKFKFKEGDVAVISSPKPGSAGKFKGRMKGGLLKERNGLVTGHITGIVRRYHPIDVRDPPGAALHFHVSQEDMDGSSGTDPTTINGNVMKELNQQGVTWYLTVLGGVTTTQREYVALHFLQQFHPKMLNAILQPRPELFPGYADQEPPAMPDCFTPAFVQHLHGHFNGPQLAAIQWAGAHTAAGSGGASVGLAGVPKQEPWPFTLVQGPPGTGKTHTVWGMLNVIHLVQYQRYYQALLKKLAPSSMTSEESSTTNQGSYENGSIDDVLQRMDDSLARMLPKLCPKPRMLVCAPSNAATDELLSRVLDRGFIDGEMRVYRPDVARVGSDPHSPAAQAVSVERRSEQLLGMGHDRIVRFLQDLRVKEVNCSQLITSLQRDLNEVATSRTQGTLGVDPEKLAARDQARDTKLQLLAAQVEERDKILVEMSRLYIVEGTFRAGCGYSPDDARQKLEASFANEAEIVFTTVSSSGRRIFTKLAHGFDMVVIDEAAQASEVAVLPPLSLRAARCVLVGDPQQLPATVISRVADTMQYSRSLFERFQQAGCPAILLSVQYRMHPQIRDFPSRYFYQGRLVDSESVKEKSDEVYHKDRFLQPYLFYDISQGRESHGGSVSYQNKLEAQVAVRLYLHLQKAMAAGSIANVSVGMITPYKQQLRCLQLEFEALVGSKADSKGVYINTVDAFQGQERDVIMMSCVRASTNGVGFVADIRRMNVALTRARRSLWVIGNAAALVQSEDWAALLADAKVRGSIVETSTCIAGGLLPDHQPGTPVLPQSGPGLLRHNRPGVLSVGRMESPSAHGMPQFGQGSFSTGGFEKGRQEDGTAMHGGDVDRWPSGHRGSRLHRDGTRGGFSQRSLPLNRSFGRGTSTFRRGRG